MMARNSEVPGFSFKGRRAISSSSARLFSHAIRHVLHMHFLTESEEVRYFPATSGYSHLVTSRSRWGSAAARAMAKAE